MMIKDAAIPSEKSTAPAKAAQTARPSFHPNELLVRWEIAVRAGDWSSAGAIAKALIVAQPAEPIGWIYHAFAQQQSGLIHEARQSLLTAAKRFPNDWRIAYNLACYAAQLGDLTGAWNWVKRAFELGGAAIVSPLAAEEPALKPLWNRSNVRPDEFGAPRPSAPENVAFPTAFPA